MNSAMIKIQERQRRKDKITTYAAAAICWLAVGIGGIIGAAIFYTFTFLFLSIGVQTMNYFKIAADIMSAGYLDAPKDSKLHRVGLKVMRRKNRQLIGKKTQTQNPVWLSAHN